jgi:hypothetical protein
MSQAIGIFSSVSTSFELGKPFRSMYSPIIYTLKAIYDISQASVEFCVSLNKI